MATVTPDHTRLKRIAMTQMPEWRSPVTLDGEAVRPMSDGDYGDLMAAIQTGRFVTGRTDA